MSERPSGPRLYGRQVGHGGLRPMQRDRMERLLPRIEVREDGGLLSVGDLFEDAQEIWLEIGFGAGEHLVWQAAENPQVGILGVEPFLTGVAKCLAALEDARAENVRLCAGDARRLLARLPDQSIDRAFILHPDPWPKWRHARRRLIQHTFLDDLSRVLKPGATLRLGTDWPDYSTWALHVFLQHKDFVWLDNAARHWQLRPEDWPETRYALKATKQGRRDVHLTFQKALSR